MTTPSEGVKWPPRLAALQAKIDERGSLRANEWDEYEHLLKRHDPEAYNKRRSNARRNYCIKLARELDVEDLMAIIKEKEAANEQA